MFGTKYVREVQHRRSLLKVFTIPEARKLSAKQSMFKKDIALELLVTGASPDMSVS